MEQRMEVVWYNKVYYVSSEWNLLSKRHWKTKLITNHIGKHGYVQRTLCNKDSHRQFRAHRLIAETFIPNPWNKSTVNHINGNKSDNRVINLEWATNKEQSYHMIHVLWRYNMAWSKAMLWKVDRKVLQCDSTWVIIKQWDSIKKAAVGIWVKPPWISRALKTWISSWGYKRRYLT